MLLLWSCLLLLVTLYLVVVNKNPKTVDFVVVFAVVVVSVNVVVEALLVVTGYIIFS